MEIILKIVVVAIIAAILYWKTVKLYYYTIGCFRNICSLKDIQDKYKLTINNQVINNLRMSTFGIMYIVVVIPEEIESKHFDEYLQEYCKFLEQSMSVQNLYGLVMTRKEKFIMKSDEEVTNTIFYLKFIPILYKNTFGRFLLFLSLSAISIYLINRFDVAQMLLDLVKLINL